MTIDFQGLADTLDELARNTWSDIADGDALGVTMGETGITERNLLHLRRVHGALIRKYAAYEEVRTGADWEWWIGTQEGWLCLLFQAKRLGKTARYQGITKKLDNGYFQVDALIKTCLDRSDRLGGTVWPLYCFYNGWPGRWPKGIPSLLYPEDKNRTVAPGRLPTYGCAVVDAQLIRQIVHSRWHERRRTLRDTYLPYSRPWSLLFRSDGQPVGSDIRAVSTQLGRWMRDSPELSAERVIVERMTTQQALMLSGETHEPHQLARRERRDRSVVWTDPVVIQKPPDYVLDLLEQRYRSRRLKPLARRVAILTY